MAVAERTLQNVLKEYRSDKTLVRAAQSGRSDAYAALVSRYYPKVYSFVSHLLSSYRHRASAPSAEDLTQEVFTRALNALSKFNGDYRFGPWLLRIARNLCVDETRRDSHRAEPADPVELPNMEPTAGVTDDVWESISKNEVVDVVRKALSRLPLRQRTVLILREIEGWSYSDIAPVVGTNVRGVEATLRRARARFRLEATNFETDENERAICRRVTHMAAADPSRFTQTELSHIERCDKCRLRTSRIRSADKIFGLMPALPLGGGGFSLRSAFDAFRSHRRTRSAGEGLKELLFKRDGVRSMIVSPFAQVVETAAALVVAAALAVSASPAQRSASAAAAQSPAITIVSPVFAQAPEVAFAEERQTNSASSSGFAAASSKQKGDGDVDLSSGILIEKVLPLDVVESGAASVIAINIDDVDSWEATDEIFTEVNEVATDLGVSSITSELDQVESLDAAAAGVSIDDLTSSAAFTEIAPRHLI